jgi:adenylate cyclase 10
MELLVKAINKSGGDIFKFAGDAMIALWPDVNNNQELKQRLL